MQAIIRRRLSRAQRALDFANAHPLTDPSFAAVVQRLSAAVTDANNVGVQQGDGKIAEHAALARRTALRDAIRSQQLRRLVHIAQLAAKTHPELAQLFPLPAARTPNKTFLLAARSLLASATANKDLFIPLGLGTSFIDDLTAALDQFDASTQTAHAGRSSHVGARADLPAIARNCQSDIEVLDTYYQGEFSNAPDLLAAWASARNIAGPFHHQAPVPAPSPVPAPLPATGTV